MAARRLSYHLKIAISIGISTSQLSHATVHPAAKWVPAKWTEMAMCVVVLADTSAYFPGEVEKVVENV